jgi:1-deoxy-D-xylulose-5-phosphate reductoisomerase
LLAKSPLTFEEPDLEAFPCLSLAYEALAAGGSHALALTAANDLAVEAFLAGRLGFYGIAEINAEAMAAFGGQAAADIAAVTKIEAAVKAHVRARIKGIEDKP